MKKYLIILLTVLFILQGFPVAATASQNDYSLLKNLGFITEEFAEKDMVAAATRDDLAVMTGKLMNLENVAPAQTIFTDVAPDSVQSGYIKMLNEAGIVQGVSETEFNPKGSVGIATAATLVFRVLGYEGLVSKDTDYANLAYRLKLEKNVQLNEQAELTNAGLMQFFANVLAMELPYDIFSYSEDGTPFYGEGEDESVLGRLLNVSVYNGVVTSALDNSYSVVVRIDENLYDSNPNVLATGSMHTFTASIDVDINSYVHVPCTFWVDENEHIVAVVPQRNVEVKYAYVYSVNGDANVAHTYSGAYINEIILNDDDNVYDVSDDLTLYYNFAETTKAVKIAGNFAKLVMKNDEIIVMELWDLTEGGIVTSVDGTDIRYTEGLRQNLKLTDFDDAKKRLIYIDGESSDIKDLRADSVFYYYKDENNFVLVVSEKKVTDVLHSIHNTQLQVGNILYNGNNVYYSTDGKNYNKKGSPLELLGQTVSVYFTPGASCLYVMPIDPDSVKKNTYIGLLIGKKVKTFGEVDVQILFLEPTIERKVYPLSKKITVGEGLDLDTVLNTVNTKQGELVLEYEIRNNEIVRISKPLGYEGFADVIKFNGFPNNGGRALLSITSAYNTSGATQTLYFFDTPLTFLYEKDGRLEAKEVPWSKLYNSNSGLDAYIHLKAFGYENNSDMRLALFCGNTEMISSEETKNYGLVVGKALAVDAEGEVCTSLQILDHKGTKNYLMPNDEAKSIPDTAYIQYFTGGILKADNEITVLSSVDLSGTVEEMQNAGLSIGTVKRIDDKRMVLTNGAAYFFDPAKTCVIYKRTQNSRGTRFDSIEKGDLTDGDTVAYYGAGNGLLCIIDLD